MNESIKASYLESLKVFTDFCNDQKNVAKTIEISTLCSNVFTNKNKILIAGNGGSACDAMHFAEELTGRFRKDRKPLPVITLTDPAHITAVANDFGFEEIFAKGIEAHGIKGDVFIGISTSGNSPNIIRAVEKSKQLGLTTIALLGRDGGKMKGMCDHEFIIAGNTSDKIQEVHMMILHIIIEGIERIMFPGNYK